MITSSALEARPGVVAHRPRCGCSAVEDQDPGCAGARDHQALLLATAEGSRGRPRWCSRPSVAHRSSISAQARLCQSRSSVASGMPPAGWHAGVVHQVRLLPITPTSVVRSGRLSRRRSSRRSPPLRGRVVRRSAGGQRRLPDPVRPPPAWHRAMTLFAQRRDRRPGSGNGRRQTHVTGPADGDGCCPALDQVEVRRRDQAIDATTGRGAEQPINGRKMDVCRAVKRPGADHVVTAMQPGQVDDAGMRRRSA